MRSEGKEDGEEAARENRGMWGFSLSTREEAPVNTDTGKMNEKAGKVVKTWNEVIYAGLCGPLMNFNEILNFLQSQAVLGFRVLGSFRLRSAVIDECATLNFEKLQAIKPANFSA
jgi:hypothetical protein